MCLKLNRLTRLLFVMEVVANTAGMDPEFRDDVARIIDTAERAAGSWCVRQLNLPMRHDVHQTCKLDVCPPRPSRCWLTGRLQ